MKKLRVLTLMHEELMPPPDASSRDSFGADWETEHHVLTALAKLGHEVRPLGASTDVGKIREALEEQRPHVVFNLMEEFHGVAMYDSYVVSYLELRKAAYTGCNPRGLMLCRDKVLAKKILSYHRIRVPDFAVFPLGRKKRRPARLGFPLLVKSVSEEASLGISQASVVTSDEKLEERVRFIHEQLGSDALAEEYIEGRELYVGLMGNLRVQAFPIWELHLDGMPDRAPHIATRRVKWDLAYQQKNGIATRAANDLAPPLVEEIVRLCKRAYRVLDVSGYARMDLRLAADGKVYLIEANPNPQLARDEDFARSAKAVGMDYPTLLQRILTLGMSYRVGWRDAA